MNYAFADTGYWVALIDDDDQLHLKAISVSKKLGAFTIVTHELVLVEVLNHFSGYGPTYRRKAIENMERIALDPRVIIKEMDSERFS